MSTPRMTRREMFQASAAAVPLVALSEAASKGQSGKRRRLTLGIATTGFSDRTNGQLAADLQQEGIRTVQLFFTQSDSNYWKYNSRSDLSDLKPERCRAIAESYRAAGLSIHSIGVYPNLIHPDPAEQKANLAYFAAMMQVGQQMGVRRFITESGHYQPKGPAAPTAFDFRQDVWKAMVATARQLAALADRYGATVLFEPSAWSFLASAKRTRVFLEEVNSPRIRALLDAANLLEVNDPEEMFNQLGPWIDCLHAKDYKLHAEHGVPAGQGDVDYRKLVRLAADRTPDAPLVIEYVGSKDYKQVLSYLRKAMRDADVSES